jgi:phosphoribosyl 1,2-cyclic phosphodiesterase
VKVHFWGTRGSVPVSVTAADIRAKLKAALAGANGLDLSSAERIDAYIDSLGFDLAGTFGGHSSCVQVLTSGVEHILLDLGSGARPFGQSILERFGPGAPQTFHVFMSHLHWDHIMGFPFFTPAYIPGNRIVIHSCHTEVERAFRRQQAAPSFPVDFSMLGAQIDFDILTPGETRQIAGLSVSAKAQLHTGDSYAWRFEGEGKALVYATDGEHKLESPEEESGYVDFFRDADLVIFDAMYSLADCISVKADWGHSSNVVGVELCQLAGAKRLALFHHEPAYSDAQIADVLGKTRRFEEITRFGEALEVIAAWDGLEMEL